MVRYAAFDGSFKIILIIIGATSERVDVGDDNSSSSSRNDSNNNNNDISQSQCQRAELKKKERQKFIQRTHAPTTVTSFSSYINSPSQREWCRWLCELMLLLIKMVTINESAKWCSKVIRWFVRSFACFYLIVGNKIGLYMLPPHSLFITCWLSKMAFSLWQRRTFQKYGLQNLSRGFDWCHKTEKYSLPSPASCDVCMEQSTRAKIRHTVS